jgi:hypothetical protein
MYFTWDLYTFFYLAKFCLKIRNVSSKSLSGNQHTVYVQ